MKKAIIIAVASVVTVGGTIGSYYGLSQSAINKNEQPRTEYRTNIMTNTNYTDVSDETEEQIFPMFTPTKRIQGDVYDALYAMNKENEEITFQRFKTEYGIDPGEEGIELDERQQSTRMIIHADVVFEREEEILRRIAKDGYGDEQKLFNGDELPLTDDNIFNYCNRINMMCNAYNDPDYEISDVDRMVILDSIERNANEFYLYFSRYYNNDYDKAPAAAKEALNYEEETYAAEFGHRPYDG